MLSALFAIKQCTLYLIESNYEHEINYLLNTPRIFNQNPGDRFKRIIFRHAVSKLLFMEL